MDIARLVGGWSRIRGGKAIHEVGEKNGIMTQRVKNKTSKNGEESWKLIESGET